MRRVLTTAAVAAALAGGAAVQAAPPANPATTQFTVSASVVKSCVVATTGPLAFGNYAPFNGAITGSTTINVNCSNGAGWTVTLDAGSTTGGTIGQRLLNNGDIAGRAK